MVAYVRYAIATAACITKPSPPARSSGVELSVEVEGEWRIRASKERKDGGKLTWRFVVVNSELSAGSTDAVMDDGWRFKGSQRRAPSCFRLQGGCSSTSMDY